MAKRSCLVVLAACLAGLAPAAALGSTTLATNPAGDQVVLYQPLVQGSRPLFAAARAPGERFGPLRAIASPPGVFDARAAVDDAGGAVAAWVSHDPTGQSPDRGFASIRAPGDEFGQPAQLFEAPPDSRITFASNPAGDTIVGTGESATSAHYAFRPAGGAFGGAGTLSTGASSFRGFSMDPDGAAHAFSELQKLDASSDIYESARPHNGDFGSPSPAAHLAFSDGLSFAASRTGRVLFLWDEHGTIRGIERAPGGSFSAPFDVAAGLNSTDIEQSASVMGAAIAPSGAAAVAIRTADGSNLVAARKPGGAFVLSSEFNAPDTLRVAIDDAGDAAAVWSTRSHAVRALYRPSSKPRFDKPITLDGARPLAPGFESPSVVIDESGRATAAWEHDHGATISLIARDFRGSRAGRREVVGALPSFVREGPPSVCRPAGARVVRRGPQSTVFVSDGYFGCLLARGAPARLINFSLRPGPPSTMSLAGPLVAYAGETEFRILDLRDPEFGVNRAGGLDGPRAAFLAVSRLKANGAAAWIACARNGKPGESRGRCLHKGGMTKHVFAWNRSVFLPRLLDSGRTIDPRSFKLRGSALSWRHGGKLRHARLR